jgi:ubiquinone/menaquinone biosynthesis C-methylase UbiE
MSTPFLHRVASPSHTAGSHKTGSHRAGSSSSLQDVVNRDVYYSPGAYRKYLSTQLTPSETAFLEKYRPRIFGRNVLDVGVGAGRTARHLAALAKRYEAVDYSPVMVSYVKSTMPEISVRQADFRDLGVFGDRSFDFVFATDNVIDALPHEGRLSALGEAARVLSPGGLLAFSSHNLRYKNAFLPPQWNWSPNPVEFAANGAKYAISWWNHIRVAPSREITPDYALINDPGHFYACLHYYASRFTVEKQLEQHNLKVIDVFDRQGECPDDLDDAIESSSLLYVAERALSIAS